MEFTARLWYNQARNHFNPIERVNVSSMQFNKPPAFEIDLKKTYTAGVCDRKLQHFGRVFALAEFRHRRANSVDRDFSGNFSGAVPSDPITQDRQKRRSAVGIFQPKSSEAITVFVIFPPHAGMRLRQNWKMRTVKPV